METLRQRTIAGLISILVVFQGCPSHCQPYSPPTFTQQPSTSIYYFGDSGSQTPTLNLPCHANGTKPLTYRWERNGMTVRVFQTNSSRDGSFDVMSASEDDVDNYTCFVTNGLGTAVSNTARVQLAFFENVTQSDAKNYSVSEGSWLRLPCDAPDGQPALLISWSRRGAEDGWPVFVNGSTWDPDRKVVQDRAGGLVLLNASLADSGSYVCEALSPVIPGVVYSREAEVVVKEATDAILLQPPKILNDTQVVNALLGEDVELYCLTVGNPTPSVRWSRQDYPSFQAADDGPVLALRNVQLDQDGAYTCTAWSTNGLEVNQTTILRVEAAPYWIIMPTDTTVYTDGRVIMSCQAGGKPAPNIQWMENGVHKPEHDGALSIRMINVTMADRKVYQCMASNVHGQITANAYLAVTEPPMVPPTDIKVYILSRTSARITWRPIVDDRLTGFKLRYMRRDSTGKEKRKDCGNLTECTLRRLKEDGVFNFKVIAVYGKSQMESRGYGFSLRPKLDFSSPTFDLWDMFNTSLYCVIILGVATPIIMCVVLCIRDQINGYEPDEDDDDDGWGGTGRKSNVEKVKVKTVHTVVRQQDGAGAGPSQSNVNNVV